MIGLNAVRYNPYERQLTKQIRLPTQEEFEEEEFEDMININAPLQPINTPTTFFNVIGSFINIAEKIIVTIGVRLTTIEASTGEVIDKP